MMRVRGLGGKKYGNEDRGLGFETTIFGSGIAVHRPVVNRVLWMDQRRLVVVTAHVYTVLC